MIDYIALTCPADTPYTPSFQDLYDRKIGYWQHTCRLKTPPYFISPNLTSDGIPATLHLGPRLDPNGNQKIELIGVRSMTAKEIVSHVESIFDVDATSLRVQRVDFAADAPNVSFEWFFHNAYVKFKQSDAVSDSSDGLRRQVKHKRKMSSIQYGDSKNIVRIYDKFAELADRERRGKLTADQARFRETWRAVGATVLTRVERQCLGDGVPKGTRTLGALLRSASARSPFDVIRLYAGGKQYPSRGDYDIAIYQRGIGIRSDIEQNGLEFVAREMNRSGNAKRDLERYKDFLVFDGGVQPPDLNVIYQASAVRQLFPASLVTPSKFSHKDEFHHSNLLHMPAMVSLVEAPVLYCDYHA